MERPVMTTLQYAILLVLHGWDDEVYGPTWKGYNKLQDLLAPVEDPIKMCDLKKAVKDLKAKGILDYGILYSLEKGNVMGAGYSLVQEAREFIPNHFTPDRDYLSLDVRSAKWMTDLFSEQMVSTKLINDLTLTLYYLKKQPLDRRTHVGYKLSRGDDVLFIGDDYCPSPLFCIDSIESIISMLSFICVQPGDTDEEYFEGYLKKQLDWVVTPEVDRLKGLVFDAENDDDESWRYYSIRAELSMRTVWGDTDGH